MNIQRQHGFTMVELVVVIVIAGILALVVAPRFIGLDAFDARGANGTLLSALEYAQKTAIAQRTTVFVNINTATRTMCLGYTNNCSTPVIDPVTQAAYLKILPSSVALTASVTPIAFDGLGRPVPNAVATFTIQNAVVASEPIRTITVEAETGYVH